jgi:hypothetical protein
MAHINIIMYENAAFLSTLKIDNYNQGLRNRTTESQSAQRTNDGDDYYSEANMLFLSSADNKVNFTSLRTLRLCG